jgi:hypothetical protein
MIILIDIHKKAFKKIQYTYMLKKKHSEN